MYKIYDIIKEKSNVRGYWIDNNKLYKDNINILEVKSIRELNNIKQKLFVIKKQLAVFYLKFNKAFIESSNGDIQVLKHNIQYKEKHITKDYLKALLLQHGGLTVFKCKDYYIIDIWRN